MHKIFLILLLFISCSFKIETKVKNASWWFNTDYYNSAEYCIDECDVYNQYEYKFSDEDTDYSPFCICMNKCTNGYVNIETDTTYCKNLVDSE